MNRLQTLRECVYNARGRTCTCFTGSAAFTAVMTTTAAPAIIGINTPVLLESPHDQGNLCRILKKKLGRMEAMRRMLNSFFKVDA